MNDGSAADSSSDSEDEMPICDRVAKRQRVEFVSDLEEEDPWEPERRRRLTEAVIILSISSFKMAMFWTFLFIFWNRVYRFGVEMQRQLEPCRVTKTHPVIQLQKQTLQVQHPRIIPRHAKIVVSMVQSIVSGMNTTTMKVIMLSRKGIKRAQKWRYKTMMSN